MRATRTWPGLKVSPPCDSRVKLCLITGLRACEAVDVPVLLTICHEAFPASTTRHYSSTGLRACEAVDVPVLFIICHEAFPASTTRHYSITGLRACEAVGVPDLFIICHEATQASTAQHYSTTGLRSGRQALNTIKKAQPLGWAFFMSATKAHPNRTSGWGFVFWVIKHLL